MLRQILRLATLSLAIATAGHAGSVHINTSSGMTLAGAPLALHGYDPVAYHTEGAAMPGSAAHTATHDGAAYRFVSAANRALFEQAPDRYLPRYGGFCAYGVAVGAKFDGDPRVFAIVDGALYLNLNPEIKATWEEDVAGNIRKAESSWRQIRDATPEELAK